MKSKKEVQDFWPSPLSVKLTWSLRTRKKKGLSESQKSSLMIQTNKGYSCGSLEKNKATHWTRNQMHETRRRKWKQSYNNISKNSMTLTRTEMHCQKCKRCYTSISPHSAGNKCNKRLNEEQKPSVRTFFATWGIIKMKQHRPRQFKNLKTHKNFKTCLYFIFIILIVCRMFVDNIKASAAFQDIYSTWNMTASKGRFYPTH